MIVIALRVLILLIVIALRVHIILMVIALRVRGSGFRARSGVLSRLFVGCKVCFRLRL